MTTFYLLLLLPTLDPTGILIVVVVVEEIMNAFKEAVQRRPFLFNSIVGYAVFASGDMMAQRWEDSAGEWDRRRSLMIGVLGIVQNGLFLRLWYNALDRFVTPKVRHASSYMPYSAKEREPRSYLPTASMHADWLLY